MMNNVLLSDHMILKYCMHTDFVWYLTAYGKICTLLFYNNLNWIVKDLFMFYISYRQGIRIFAMK